MWIDLHSIEWVTLIQVLFIMCQQYFYFQYHQHKGQSKTFQNLFFTLLDLSLKQLNLTRSNFPQVYSGSKDGSTREFLKTDSNSMFSK